MIAITPPSFGVTEIVEACGESVQSSRLRARQGEFKSAEDLYRTLAISGNLHTMPRPSPGIDDEGETDAVWVYDKRMVPKSGSARQFYNAIKGAAPFGKCTLCLQRVASELDHVLPKSYFPAQAFQPTNLVPVCSVCNKLKSSTVGSGSLDQPMHPYFDPVATTDWLEGELLEIPTAPVYFSVKRLPDWSDELHARMVHHFERLSLGSLYSSNSAALLGNFRFKLDEEIGRSGSNAVASFLMEMATSFERNGAEPWSVQSMRAWASSSWFCSGGWRDE